MLAWLPDFVVIAAVVTYVSGWALASWARSHRETDRPPLWFSFWAPPTFRSGLVRAICVVVVVGLEIFALVQAKEELLRGSYLGAFVYLAQIGLLLFLFWTVIRAYWPKARRRRGAR